MKKIDKKPKAVVYCRVVTCSVRNRSDSLKGQEESCLSKLKGDNKYQLTEVIKDVEYSKSEKNVGKSIPRILSLAKERKISGMYVSNLDRISRDLNTLFKTMDFLNRHGVKIISISAPHASDSFSQSISVILANFYREHHSEKIKRALAHKKESQKLLKN